MLEIISTIAISITLILVLFGCICGCRKDSHKSELIGTAGIVKLNIEEEIQPAQTSPVSTKRVSSQNSHRSLPEIPPSVPRQDSGDTASDLYATVGTNQRVLEQNSPIVANCNPYEHAYARLQNENRANETINENEDSVNDSSIPTVTNCDVVESQATTAVTITASVAINGQVSSSVDLPYMTLPVISVAPVTEPSQSFNNPHFSGDSGDFAKGYTSISVREPLSSIRTNVPTSRSQPHYATVSDDSDEMYAAIEEPINQVYTSGSETYAQIQPTNTLTTPHSAITDFISISSSHDVLDSVTLIQNGPYNHQQLDKIESNSKRTSAEIIETHVTQNHARQASNSSHAESVGTLGSPKPEKRQANSPLPPPPSSTDISNISNQHKKLHDSPGHKRIKHHKISSTGNLHENDKTRRSFNEKHQRNNSCVSSSDFYGCNYPVDKHRFSSGDLVRPLVAIELNFPFDKPTSKSKTDEIYNTIDGPNDIYSVINQESSRKTLAQSQPNVTGSPIKSVEEMYAKVIKKSKNNACDNRLQPNLKLSNYDDNSFKSEHNANSINSVPVRKKSLQHENERLSWSNEIKRFSGVNNVISNIDNSKNSSLKSFHLQILDKDDPGYETIDKMRNKAHGYESIGKNIGLHKSEKASDPGYETVKEFNSNDKHQKIISTVSGGLMKSQINSLNILQKNTVDDDRNSPLNEPGYETVPSGPESLISNDPGYEHIHRSGRYASDSEPNYEILRSRNSTSPYASIRNKSQNTHGYSKIAKKNKKPENNSISNNNDCFLSEPNYESMPHEAIYNTGSESDPNYESVGPKDPNYESVKYFDVTIKDPPYEKVKNDSANSLLHRSSSSSSYEKVKLVAKNEKQIDDNNDNRNNVSSLNYTSENVSDYFQV